MAMTVEQALQVSVKVRGANSTYILPPEVRLGDVAEAMHVLGVSLKRYRQAFHDHSRLLKTIDAGTAGVADQGVPTPGGANDTA